MGLLSHSSQLNSRDIALGHRRVHSSTPFREDIEESGLIITELGGVYLKPLSNSQIQDNWNDVMIKGFFQLGKDFPELSAESFAVCKND